MIKAVIFDKDGVLIDSEETHIKSTAQAFGEFGVELSKDDKEFIVGRSPIDYMPIFAKKYNLSAEVINKIDVIKKQYYYELLKEAPIFHSAVDLLKTFYKIKVPIALCTQGSRKNAITTLDLIGIKEYFSHIITREDCSKGKPDPEPYLISAKKLSVKPENCLVIEDSEIGLKAALNAGMQCIVVFNEYTKNHNFTGALEVVDSAKKINLGNLKIR